MNIKKYKTIKQSLTPKEKTVFENPSIGFNYVKKLFPDSCNSFRRMRASMNKFDETFLSKNFQEFHFALKKMKIDDENKFDLLKNGNNSHQTKMNLKWATIKWLINNKKRNHVFISVQLEKILVNHRKLLEISDKHVF